MAFPLCCLALPENWPQASHIILSSQLLSEVLFSQALTQGVSFICDMEHLIRDIKQRGDMNTK